VSYLGTTQDSLPVAGQALLDGLLTRKVPMKGFRVEITSHPPFPSFLAQSMRPTRGGLIDEEALADALESGQLAGAGPAIRTRIRRTNALS
jgi:hypothetical protein